MGISGANSVGSGVAKRWPQLVLGILCMVMIANLQYGWTLFVQPIDAKFHWGRPAIQVAFTVFVLMETWLLPIEGYIVDRIGPGPAVAAGGVLIGAGWTLNAVVASLPALYAAAAISGLGAGLVYGTTVGNAVKWFPNRRGLASGLTAAGFGAGSALTIIPISGWIASHGYQSAFLVFGLFQGICVLVLSAFLRRPPQAAPAAGAISRSSRDIPPQRVVRHPAFWLMYAIFVMVGAGGLMATAQLAVIARDYGVASSPVTLMAITMPALTFALSLDRIMNGITRPFFGWVSDRIGRENTMFVAFLLEAAGIAALVAFAHDPVSFVILSGLVFFAWGEIYSLFPATCTDTFGARFATANYGLLYTAKGTASLLVPLSSVLQQAAGWTSVFYVASALNLAAALLALLVLKPLRRRNMTVPEAPQRLQEPRAASPAA
jgi:MFS transporter, OFA family, oxalate/formate antiporter